MYIQTKFRTKSLHCSRSKKLSYSDVSRSRWDTATDKYVGKVVILYCKSYIHLGIREKFRDMLDVELLRIATGVALVV
jgi:hypothetical protein